jgi:hypothetical protein
MSIKKQKDKLSFLINRAGLWNEGLGFCFLLIAVITSIGSSTNSFVINLFSFNTSIGRLLAASYIAFIIIYTLFGLGLIVTGYYLHNVRGKYTKAFLIISILLSLITVINILPLIPLIFSVSALNRLRNTKLTIVKKIKLKQPFDARDYPAISITSLLLAVILLSSIIGFSHVHKITKMNNADVITVPKVADCQSGSVNNSDCIVMDTANKFSITFPAQPVVNSKKVKGSSVSGASFDENSEVIKTDYQYNHEDSNHRYHVFFVEVVSYDKSLAEIGQDNELFQDARLRGLENESCIEAKGKSLKDYTTKLIYKELPAQQLEILDGRTFGEGTCSFESMTIIKGRQTYSIGHVSTINPLDITEFTNFLQSFNLTN